MTDTSTEAVEWRAHKLNTCAEIMRKYKAGVMDAAELDGNADTLRALAAERDALKAEVERLQSVNELMCAQIDSLPPPEPDLLKRQLRKVADKRARADLQENTDD